MLWQSLGSSLRLGLSLSLAVVFAFSWGAASAPLTASYPPLAADEAAEAALLKASNLERERADLPLLQSDEALALAARHHAEEMLELRYLAHQSPTPENATLALRVARAGSPAQYLAENLALLPVAADPDALARQTLEGWMASPGHRANVLQRDFSHVGFGVARSERGDVYVAQVLASLPLRLLAADIAPLELEEARVELAFELRAPAEVLVLYGEAQLSPQALGAGRHRLRLPYSGQEPLHIQVGVRAPGSNSGFIGQDGGWFYPAEGSWQASGQNGGDLAILGAERLSEAREVYSLELRFAEPLPDDLGLWLGEVVKEARTEGDTLTLELPRADHELELAIGLPREQGDGRYDVVLALTVKTVDGAPRLYPASAHD